MNIGLSKYRYFETLKASEPFRHVEDSEIAKLLEGATSQYLPKKTCILDTKETCHKFYIIVSGKLKVYSYDLYKDRQITLFLLKKSDVFDIFALAGHKRQQIYYETLTKTELISIPIDEMKAWMATNPTYLISFLSYVIKKTGELQKYVTDVILKDTTARLAFLILQHMNCKTQRIELINDLPNHEWAGLIGTTRAVLNRNLQLFKEEGILKTSRNFIEVTNLELLKEKCHDVR